MIEFMDQTTDRILAVRFTGKLTESDYGRVLRPRLEQAAAQSFGRVRALIYMDDAFRGWDMKAAWANTRLDFVFRNALERVAIVGVPRWEQWRVRAAGLLVKGELKTFSPERIMQAWEWLRS